MTPSIGLAETDQGFLWSRRSLRVTPLKFENHRVFSRDVAYSAIFFPRQITSLFPHPQLTNQMLKETIVHIINVAYRSDHG